MEICHLFLKPDLFDFTVSCFWVPGCVWVAGYLSFVSTNSFFNKSTLRDCVTLIYEHFEHKVGIQQWHHSSCAEFRRKHIYVLAKKERIDLADEHSDSEYLRVTCIQNVNKYIVMLINTSHLKFSHFGTNALSLGLCSSRNANENGARII